MKKKVLALVMSAAMLTNAYLPAAFAAEPDEQVVPACKQTEHIHGDGCYTASETLVCGIEEGAGAHTHNESCYSSQPKLICALAEEENHSHGEECYAVDNICVCGKEESDGHIHNSECYEQTLTCTAEEHRHSEECYAAAPPEPACTCGIGTDTHGKDCPMYTEEKTNICICGEALIENEDGTFTHLADCPLYAECAEAVTELFGETDSGVSVAVFGEFSGGTELSLADADVTDIPGFDYTYYGVGYSDSPYVALDISMVQDGAEIQPEQPVTVSVSAQQLNLNPGDRYIVYHVHDGAVEQLGPFSNDSPMLYSVNSTGVATFELDSFSYVIIVNSTVRVTDVESFYRTGGQSTNNHYHAIGVYFTTLGEAHLLVGGDQNLAGKLEIGSVSVNGQNVDGATYKFYGRNVAELKLQNEDNTTDVTNLLDPKFPHILDFNLGYDIKLSEKFTITIKWTAQGGHNINGMEVTVIFDDGIKKTVYSINGTAPSVSLGEAPEVKHGDEIVYKIEVKNGETSTQAVSGDVVDILPAGIFDVAKVQFKIGENGTWTDAAADANRLFVLENNLTLQKGGSKTYYVKASVLNTAQVGSYINTSRFVKSENNWREATATVKVTLPPRRDLTITKEGCQPVDEHQSFIFTISGPNDFTMEVVINGNNSVTVKDLPTGEYTVKENTDWSWRYTPDSATKKATLTAAENGNVTFNNSRSCIYWLSGDSYNENRFAVKNGNES